MIIENGQRNFSRDKGKDKKYEDFMIAAKDEQFGGFNVIQFYNITRGRSPSHSYNTRTKKNLKQKSLNEIVEDTQLPMFADDTERKKLKN